MKLIKLETSWLLARLGIYLQLTSTIFSLHAENIELTSSKAGRFTCPGDQVTFTCRVFRSSALEWRNPLITQLTSYTALYTPPNLLPRGPLNATLISVSGTNLQANFTSTLQVAISRMMRRNETTVMCFSGTLENVTDNFTVAGMWRYLYMYGFVRTSMCLISIPVVSRIDKRIFLHFKFRTPMHGGVCFNMNTLIAGAQTNRAPGWMWIC